MEDGKLVVKNRAGEPITLNVIDIVEDESTNIQYICYTIESDDTILISKVTNENNIYILDEVSEYEREAVEQAIIQRMEQKK